MGITIVSAEVVQTKQGDGTQGTFKYRACWYRTSLITEK